VLEQVIQSMMTASDFSCAQVLNVSQLIQAMPQEKLKLISARVDPATLAKIDQFLKRHYYWKRNTVINNILGAVFDKFTDSDIYDMVRFDRDYQMNASASFTLK
jgi:hypothetical protein